MAYDPEYQRKYREANREKCNEAQRRWRAAHPEQWKKTLEEYRSRPAVKDAARKRHRKRVGIADADGQLKSGACECCGQATEKLNLDHDHITGKIRGWLCRSCNLALGHMKDDVSKLYALIAYLTKSG